MISHLQILSYKDYSDIKSCLGLGTWSMAQTLLYKELLEIIHFSFWCVFKASNTKTWERISWFKFEFIHNNGCGDRAAGCWGDFFPGEFGQMCCCVVNYRPSWKPVLQLLAAPCLKLQRLNLKPRSCWTQPAGFDCSHRSAGPYGPYGLCIHGCYLLQMLCESVVVSVIFYAWQTPTHWRKR